MTSSVLQSRHPAAYPSVAEGSSLERLTSPSRLFGADGLRTGPQGPFAGITIGRDGTLYVSADGDGSVLALRRVER
jgi:hypothetical protein